MGRGMGWTRDESRIDAALVIGGPLIARSLGLKLGLREQLFFYRLQSVRCNSVQVYSRLLNRLIDKL